MKCAGCLVLIGLTLTAAATQSERPLPVLRGTIGSLHHPIRTARDDVQRLFDQGLTLYYAFSRDGARRSFERAASLDGAAAMPHVGVALALGPNLNADSTPAQQQTACVAARKALALAHQPDEQQYATALAIRYCDSITDQTATAYVRAMHLLTQQFPDDVDAATLYADSLLALRRRSAQQDADIVSVLESILARQPDHVGANHYYIHVIEGSPTPERALPSARRLETLVTASGHLLHMPSHIYFRLGDYAGAIACNVKAADVDRAYIRDNPGDDDAAMYYLHDLESLAVAAGFAGRFGEAREAAVAAASVAAAGATDRAFPTPLTLTLLRFYRWRDVLEIPAPDTRDVPSRLMFHFARAVAYAQLRQTKHAEAERDAFEQAASALPDSAVYRSNPVPAVLALFRAVIGARLAWSRKDTAAAVDAWERAVAAQDRLAYHEPPPFYYPTRESLGAALFAIGRYQEADRVFTEDLKRHPGNGRSLYGIWQSQRASGSARDAESARRSFANAWMHSDVQLRLSLF